MNIQTFSKSFKSDYLVYSHKKTRSTDLETFAPHAHNGYEILYVLSGIISYEFEEKEVNLKAGDIIITSPAQYHSLRVYSNEDYERINLIIFPQKINMDLKLDHSVFLTNERNKTIQKILKDFASYHADCNEEERKDIFNIKARELIFALNHFLPSNQSAPTPIVDETLKAILNFVNANLKNKITVSDIANHCFISEGHIFHLFNKKFRTSPMHYIKTKKMLLAQNLISNTSNRKSITTIAFDLGFDEYSVFYRNYIKFFHHKPSDDLRED